ncbi:MAG TPA: RNA 2',3'-cyclic phosphodiesterase [Candidatus Kapabacteria bacterium]|nr:RNA 2',3'-cyclic phosphodiesterase [Candidatus Kapabacteria bacterium]
MKVRCFTALCFSPPVLDKIAEHIKEIKQIISPEAGTIKWERKENIHLTLNFFGEIEETILQKLIEETKKRMSPHEGPLHLSLSGIGTFPDERHPKVIWLGCEDKSNRLEKIHAMVNDIAKECGEGQVNIEDRRFTPHITIGRVKMLNKPFLLVDALHKYAKNDDFLIDENVGYLSYMRSVLTSGGSVYATVENIPL